MLRLNPPKNLCLACCLRVLLFLIIWTPCTLLGQDFEWTITAGSSNYSEFGIDVDVDPQGNAYLGGEYYDGAVIGDSTFASLGDNDLFMAKYDPYGGFIWATHFGGNQLDRVYAINAGVDGSIFFTGYGKIAFPAIKSSPRHARDAIFGRLNQHTGELIWGRSLDGDVFSEGTDVLGLSQGKCLAGGRMNSLTFLDNDTLFGNGLTDGMLIKFGAQGAQIWSRNIGGTGEDDLYAVGMDRDENIVAGGYFSGTAQAGTVTLNGTNGKDAYLTKMDSAGNFLWGTVFTGTGDAKVTCLKVAPDGSVYFGGTFTDGLSVGSFNFTSIASTDFFYGKTDANGIVQWAHHAGGSSLDLVEDIDIDEQENVYLAGFFIGSLSLQGNNVVSGGVDDLFFCKLDSSGNLSNFVHSAYQDTRDAFGVAADNQGNALLSGTFIEMVDFGGDTIYSVANSADVFMTKYSTVSESLVIDSVSGLDQCVDSLFYIHYSYQGFFDSTNVLMADLSDANGSFTSPVQIAMLQTGVSGVLTAVVPPNTPSGTGYRVRLRTSNPNLMTPDNGVDLTLERELAPNLVISGDTVLCNGNPVVLQISSAYSSQSWSNGGTGTVSVYTSPGSAWVHATDANGCSQTLHFEVVVCTDRDTPEKPSISVSPNPNRGKLRIALGSGGQGPWTLRLTDLTGRIVWQESFESVNSQWVREFQLPEFPDGIYPLEITGPEDLFNHKILFSRD